MNPRRLKQLNANVARFYQQLNFGTAGDDGFGAVSYQVINYLQVALFWLFVDDAKHRLVVNNAMDVVLLFLKGYDGFDAEFIIIPVF